MQSKLIAAVAAVGFASIFGAVASAASVTPGDLLVYRVGDGSGVLSNTGSAVFIDEYTAAGVLVQSFAAPTAASGGNNPLISSGTATSEGLISLSADQSSVVLTGYGRAIGGTGSLSATTSAAVPRTVGVLNVVTGAMDTTTALGDFASANNPRSVTSTNGTDLWVGGAAGGVRYAVKGGTTSTQLSTTVTNIRQVSIFGGQLYSSDSSGSAVRLGAVGTGLPTTSGQTIVNLPGLPVTGSPYAFFLADLSTGVAGLDTLYVADDTAGAAGGLLKYSLVGGSWTANGIVGSGTDAIRGLTATVSSAGVVSLFGTTGASAAGGGGSIYSFVDSTGYNSAISGSLTTIATAGTNTAFRGIAVLPAAIPEPTGMGLVAVAAAGLMSRRRRA